MRYALLKNVFIASFTLTSTSALAADEILYRFKLDNPSDTTLQKISETSEITARHGNNYDVLVLKERVPQFLQTAKGAELVSTDENKFLRENAHDFFAPGQYHDFNRVQQMLRDAATKHPQITKVITYGQTESGKPLLALKISANVQDNEGGKTKVLIDAATHGDEIITVEILSSFLDELLNGYPNTPRVSKIINGTELFFIPVENPEGFTRQQRYSNGTDPNRDYPWPEKPNKQPEALCTSAIMSFIAKNNIKAALSLHAFGQLIMYPWGYTAAPLDNASDTTLLDTLVKNMAQENHYETGPIATTIYVAKGSSVDYYYWKQHTLGIAMEIGESKAPPASQIPAIWNEVRESLYKFVEEFIPSNSNLRVP